MSAEGNSTGAASRGFLAAAAALAVVGLALATVGANTIPGLHADEAWVMLRVREIADGARPLFGMNHYTGALHQYLAWPFLAASGFQVWGLRLVGALANVAALLVGLDLLRRLHPAEPTVWRWTGALCVTAAPFVVFSRFGIETAMLEPVLVLGALWLLLAVPEPRRAGALAGLTLGLAVYNHALALAAIAAILIGALAGQGWNVWRHPRMRWLVMGLAIGLLPTGIGQLLPSPATPTNPVAAGSASPPPSTMPDSAEVLEFLWRLVLDLAAVPFILAGMLDGGLLFQRVAGERLLPVIPHASVALVVCACLAFRHGRGASWSPIDRAILAAALVLPLVTVLIAPRLALRYFQLPALLLPYALARFAQAAFIPRFAAGLLAAMLALQVGYLATNYFWAFARSGGRLSDFAIGWTMVETSNHLVRTDRLYRELVAAGVRGVIGDPFTARPLAALDIPSGRLSVRLVEAWELATVAAAPDPAAGPIAIVGHARDGAARKDHLSDRRDAEQFDIGGYRYRRAPGFDPRFVVFLGTPR